MKKILVFTLIILLGGCKSGKEKKDQGKNSSEETAFQNPETRESFSRGAKIYSNFCASCHLSNGEGIPNAFPPIAGSNWLTEKREETIRAVKYGLQGVVQVNGEEYNSFMPAMGLSDEEVTDVLNYIFNAWENNIDEPATVAEVKAVKK